jgi:hypothetical protein
MQYKECPVNETRNVARDITLNILETHWANFLKNINCLTPEQRERYLDTTNTESENALLVLVCKQWRVTLYALPLVADSRVKANSIPDSNTILETQHDYSDLDDMPRTRLEEEFETLRTRLIQEIIVLSERALMRPQVRHRLNNDILRLYARIAPPTGAKV